MNKLPGALVIIDTNREMNALREARALHIPTIALIDTDGDPNVVDLPIPGNDDSMRSIDVIMRELTAAVTEGVNQRPGENQKEASAEETAGDQTAQNQRPSSSRSRFRGIASASASADATAENAGEETAPPAEAPAPEGESAPAS